MNIAQQAMHVFFCLIGLLPFAEQETDKDKIVKSAATVELSLEQVLDKVYAQYSDKKFETIDVWYIQDAPNFPPMKFHYAMDGEDRLRGQFEENGTKYILMFVNGRTTIYSADRNQASIIPGKEPLQDSCNYLSSLITSWQRGNSSSFPETLRNESLGWKLDNNYWVVDGHDCFKLTNKREEFFVDPKIGYSFRWKNNDSRMRVGFSDFRTIDSKWMPFQVEFSADYGSWKISVESLEFGGRKSLDKEFPPGTFVHNSIDSDMYILDANGNRRNLPGAIETGKDALPKITSNRRIIFIGVVLLLIGVAIALLRKRKTSGQ